MLHQIGTAVAPIVHRIIRIPYGTVLGLTELVLLSRGFRAGTVGRGRYCTCSHVTMAA